MKQNCSSKSSRSAQKTDCSDISLTTHAMKHCECDTSWSASSPYPTWPFTRVRGSELVKRERLAQKINTDHFEEALL